MALADSPSRIIRPKSSFVQVTDISSKYVNPKPLSAHNSHLSGDYITEGKLREITKCDDLKNLSSLELEVDVEKVTFGNFGSLLPNLLHLKFINSRINAVREIGTGFGKVEVLWMCRCTLRSLDGLSSMGNLVELYMSFNEISDLSPCAMLEFLEVLDLEGNSIKDKENLNYLRTCKQLINLTLEGNPIITECGGLKKYRTIIRNTLPQVKFLDDVPVKQNPTQKHSGYDIVHFDNEWNHINGLLKEVGLLSVSKDRDRRSSITGMNEATRLQSKLQGRPSSIIRPFSSHLNRCKPNRIILLSESGYTEDNSGVIHISRPASSLATESEEASADPEDDGSKLTTGKVVCGGISSALRNRRSSTKPDGIDLLGAETHVKNSESKLVGLHPEENDSNYRDSTTTNSTVDVNDPGSQTYNKENDPILKEEEELRMECDQVLKELDDWRKQFSNRIFKPRERPSQVQKFKSKSVEQEAVLISTESDSTAEELTDKTKQNDSLIGTKCEQGNQILSNQNLNEIDAINLNSTSSGDESHQTNSNPEKLINEGSIESGISSGQETFEELNRAQSPLRHDCEFNLANNQSFSKQDDIPNCQMDQTRISESETSMFSQHLPGQTNPTNSRTKTLSTRYQSRSPFPPINHSMNNRQSLNSSTLTLSGGKTPKKQSHLDLRNGLQSKLSLSRSTLLKSESTCHNPQSLNPMSRNGSYSGTNVSSRLATKLSRPNQSLLPSKPTLKHH